MISTIYLDMDGVLTNFEEYYHKVIGINPKGITPEEWDENWEIWVLNGYFEVIPMLPGARELLDYVASTGIKTEILSSTGGSDFYEDICRQKRSWLETHNIPWHANFTPGKKYKSEYATEHRLLIDDKKSIIDNFIDAGGHGITHVGVTGEDMAVTISKLRAYLNAEGYQKYE